MSHLIALVGRPNVGKSTLFNRLAGKKLAIIDDQPGVTRDYKIAPLIIDQRVGEIMDTAGLTDSKDQLEQAMTRQSMRALQNAVLLIFLIDGTAGVTPMDMEFARKVRKLGKPILLVANKADRKDAAAIVNETKRLGFGDPMMISASHNIGVSDLMDKIVPYLAEQEDLHAEEEDFIPPDDDFEGDVPDAKSLRIAIVGRPNAGKSTLLNALLREERSLTADLAGTTRDPVSVEWNYDDRQIRLVDTAGMRRRSKVVEKIEQMAVDETLRIIRLAELVVVVVDATQPFDQQDMTIIQHVFDEGRAMVLAINKWDKIEDKKAAEQYIQDALDRMMPFVRGIPVVTMSAIKGGKKLDTMMKAIFAQHRVWNKRVGTGVLNRWLQDMISRNPPPLAKGRPNKLRYITQTKSRPPTFAVWVSQPDQLPDTYDRFLINGMREKFKMPGVPIRIHRKKGENPYAK